MNLNDKILKSSFNYVESIKDVINKNIVLLANEGKLKIESSVLPQLISALNQSFDEGSYRGQNFFLKEINNLLNENNVVDASVSKSASGFKKK
jgi:hypothetical protein